MANNIKKNLLTGFLQNYKQDTFQGIGTRLSILFRDHILNLEKLTSSSENFQLFRLNTRLNSKILFAVIGKTYTSLGDDEDENKTIKNLFINSLQLSLERIANLSEPLSYSRLIIIFSCRAFRNKSKTSLVEFEFKSDIELSLLKFCEKYNMDRTNIKTYPLPDFLTDGIEGHLIDDMIPTIDEIITEKIKQLNNEYIQIYTKSMSQEFYLEKIPYHEQKGESIQNKENIKHQLEIEVIPNSIQQAKGDIVFISSEFGFGKTSLLLQLSLSPSEASNILYWYIPFASLNGGGDKYLLSEGKGFISEYNFCKFLTAQLLPEEDVNDRDTLELYTKVLKKMLKNQHHKEADPSIIFVFDAFDEYEKSDNHTKMKELFESINAFSATFIITIRKELIHSYIADFEGVLSFFNKRLKRFELKDWETEHIIEYIRSYLLTMNDDSNKKNIEDFLEQVKVEGFEKIWGDIPKRPMFLNMILKDVSNNTLSKHNNLSNLYEKYIEDKIIKGSRSIYTRQKIRVKSEKSDTENIKRLFTIMATAASEMLQEDQDSKQLKMLNSISKEQLITIITKTADKWSSHEKEFQPNMLEILLNSVLVGSGNSYARRLSHSIQIKFAHKSFQEYFTARFFYNILVESSETEFDKWFNRPFSPTMDNVFKLLSEILSATQHEESTIFQNIQSKLYTLDPNNSDSIHNQLKSIISQPESVSRPIRTEMNNSSTADQQSKMAVSGENVTILAISNSQVTGSDVSIKQNINQEQIDLSELANELSKLRIELSKEATETEHYIAVGNIASAESEAKKGNLTKVHEFLKEALKKGGPFVSDVVKKLGVSLIADEVKKIIT